MMTNDWRWKKKGSLAEQLKFFGAKKQKFISVYAKKPRILVKVKAKDDLITSEDNLLRALAMQDHIIGTSNLRSAQCQSMLGGLGGSGQMSASAQCQNAQAMGMGGIGQAQFGYLNNRQGGLF